jgi:hypothetical protein
MLDSQDKGIEIDLFDKQISFIKGTKSKDITQYIPISINAIEVRKSNLKELLEVIDGTDLDLVREARNLGF